MSNAFALSVGLRRGSYYQTGSNHGCRSVPGLIAACVPLPRGTGSLCQLQVFDSFSRPKLAMTGAGHKVESQECLAFQSSLPAPCPGSPVLGTPSLARASTTADGVAFEGIDGATAIFARIFHLPFLRLGVACGLGLISGTNSTIVWPFAENSSKAVRLRTCALHYLDASMQTRRIGYKRDTSGHGGVRGRPPYVALVPWSVPRQSPAASHRVEKHSAVLCRTKPGNRVANSSLSGVRADAWREGAALQGLQVAHPRPKEKSHSSRRMQLADSQYRSSPSGS
ncbi:hypothetical protein M431DRAFT_482082 [Trichoderma harzianum CBS 226.95]|uniref:Uncharacterized protein n=1 Tax=Trichoderma harzianum CBS 226.95 TaxID=983964 RepID=A0A2T4ACU5_TRIHA|nr:hypothetical protein M431DRAFT_482082 [Trichoderma harzianum CBS 226.95]PTB54899.1 hypothetical protein M431DRAFT_482082 [Trichoderma harzianum CBS 226.95]